MSNNKISTNIGIKPYEFDNIPIEGFVLNKKAGGTKNGWNARQTYCRVYDPRGFEIELSIPNLLYILENTNSIKGKGLEGKFVYGWDSKNLVLIPENSPEYKDMVEFSDMQNTNIKKSELILGGIFIDSMNEKWTYLGDGFKKYYSKFSAQKMPWFSHCTNSSIDTKDIKTIKKYTGEIDPNFANLVDKLEKHECYFKNKPEFELIPNVNEVLRDWFVTKSDFDCFTLNREGKMILIQISKGNREYVNHYYVWGDPNSSHYSREAKYSSIEQLTNKLKLWQLKTTK